MSQQTHRGLDEEMRSADLIFWLVVALAVAGGLIMYGVAALATAL